MELAVLGLHLTGQPLNFQLTELGARLRRTCRTAPEYRCYVISDPRGRARETSGQSSSGTAVALGLKWKSGIFP